MKRILLVFILFLSSFAANGAEIFYNNGTSVSVQKAEDMHAVKSDASKSEGRKDALYRLNTGLEVYSFVSGTEKRGGDELPIYFLGDMPVVAERTVFWRGEKSVEYMEKQYDMKLVEILPTYPLYAFSVKGDSVEISEKIVKNGDGYAFPDLVEETVLHFVPESVPQDPYFDKQWHLHNSKTVSIYTKNADVKFLQMLEFLNSNNIEVDTNAKVAIMDTGVSSNHEDLTNLDIGWDALAKEDGGYPDSDVSGSVAHGTSCAGISAGVGNDIGVSGVCPWCRLYPVKWQTGHGSTSHSSYDVLPVYERYVSDPDITTINCSFGAIFSNGISFVSPADVEAVRNFMQNGRSGKGGVVVYSSGNDNVDSSYKRILEYDFRFNRNGVEVTDRVVTVNATNSQDMKAYFSNYGYASTVSAPGLYIATTTIPGYGDYPAGGSDYQLYFSGTSAAAPVVSGFFGVIFSINPDLTLEEAMDILKQSSDKINPETGFWDETGFSVKYGYGRVNLEKAARLAAGFPMCENAVDEECGNHIDDDCDGYVDEGCSEALTAGTPCTEDEDCLTGSLTISDVKCVTERSVWVFKGGYCFRKLLYSSFCPDGTRSLYTDDYNLCALECNKEHPCKREGYYCSDEVLGVCLPLCSDNSDCTSGYSCNGDGHCVPQCGNGVINREDCDGYDNCVVTDGVNEECDDGDDNGKMDCDDGKKCSVCTADCKIVTGSYCGDGKIDIRNGEVCDYGSYNGTNYCAYGMKSCKVCTKTCQEGQEDGMARYCGDGVRTSVYEVCDDGNNEDGDYCSAYCEKVTGSCGDGIIQSNEECDEMDENGKSCAYGETSCTVCTANCQQAAGSTSFCGDGNIDAGNNEACDNGSDNGRTDCAYGETSCELCTNQCQKTAGATSYCGDGNIDAENSESCDNGAENGRTNCAYGETGCELCTTQCRKIAGATSYCGDGNIDTTNNEACDNGADNGRTNCAYGETGCELCTTQCQKTAGATSFCGDGIVDAVNNEACDNGFANGLSDCIYGETNCIVCTNECQENQGVTSFCGDGLVDHENDEICDEGELNGEIDHCNSTCSGIVVEIPDDTPDEDIPDDDNPDEDAPDGDEITDVDEITDDNPDEEAQDVDETTDIDEISDSEEISDGNGTPDNEEHSDSEEVSDSSETPDEGGNQTDDGNSSSDETVETDDSSEEPSSDNENPATEDKKKSGGCTLLVI